MGELYSAEAESSDDEYPKRKTTPRTQKSSKTKPSVSRTTTTSVPKDTPQRQHQSNHQQATPMNAEAPMDRTSMPPRPVEINPGPSASMNYNSRRPIPKELEDTASAYHFQAVPNSNQYVPSTAPQYSPPPPPPRPAKIPEQEDSQHVPVSPVGSIKRTGFDDQEQPVVNGHRYNNSYSHQDFNSGSRVPFADAENYGQTSAKKPARKLASFLKA